MNKLTQHDLISSDEYERQREAYRQTIINLKHRRRIGIGEKITMVFENRDTVRFQIQEMIRAERIVDQKKVQDELDVYNALLPGAGELSATLLIELTEAETMKPWLDLFMGLDHGQKLGLRAGERSYTASLKAGTAMRRKSVRYILSAFVQLLPWSRLWPIRLCVWRSLSAMRDMRRTPRCHGR